MRLGTLEAPHLIFRGNMKRGIMKILRSFVTIALIIIPICAAHGDNAGNSPKTAVLSADGIQAIDIIVDSYSFEPKHIILKVGIPVEVNLRSVTSIVPHDFVIDDPSSGLDIIKSVPAGQDARVVFTPGRTGKFKFYCGKSGMLGSHRDKGMEGVIEVVE